MRTIGFDEPESEGESNLRGGSFVQMSQSPLDLTHANLACRSCKFYPEHLLAEDRLNQRKLLRQIEINKVC